MKKFLPIIFAAVFLLFYRLGSTTLVNWDESWLASVSQDIAIRGDWLGGQWNGQTWFYEPPLVTWMLAVLYKIFGPSEFWLRSPNAVFGILIVIITYKLSALITKSAASAFISVIILLSDIEFLFRGRQINVEIPVTFFLLLTIFFLFSYNKCQTFATDKRQKSDICLVLTGISLGLAFLTKRASPILTLPAISYVFLAKKNVKGLFIFFITLISVILPWIVISYLKWGNQFINEFFLGYTLGKIRSINPAAGADIWFYITALRHAFKFFFPLIPFAIIWASVKSFRDRKIAVLTIFILTFLIFLTLAPIKSSWFLLPVHPAIAIIVGLFIISFALETQAKLTNLRVRLAACLPAGRSEAAPSPPVMASGRRRTSKFPSTSLPSAKLIIMVMTIAAWQIWHYRHDFIVPDTTGHQAALAKLAGQLTPPENPIYLDDDYLPVAVFYSRRRVVPLRFNRLQPITPLPIPSGSHILTNTQTLPTLQNNYPNTQLVKETADLILIQNK